MYVKRQEVKNALDEVREAVYNGFYPNAEAFDAAKETIKKAISAFNAVERYRADYERIKEDKEGREDGEAESGSASTMV